MEASRRSPRPSIWASARSKPYLRHLHQARRPRPGRRNHLRLRRRASKPRHL